MIIVAATQNKHKIEEIAAITRPFGMEIISRKEAGVPDFEVEEDGETFEENSEKKARAILKACGQITIADDSGLVVDALGGAPGVYSSRYAGEEGNDAKNNVKLLAVMSDIPMEERTAKFVSVITMLYPDGGKLTARGECRGHIIFEEKGDNGFGYDPLFVPEGFSKTFAELTAEEKNKISHRASALRELERLLREKENEG